MRKVTQLLVAIALAFAVSSTATAAEEQPIRPQDQLWLFFGGFGSYIFLDTNVFNDFDKDGFQIGGEILGAYYLGEDWVFDFGAGWSFTQISTDSNAATTFQINQRAGFAEVVPKYRLSEHWQIGIPLTLYFGTDLTFSPTVAESSTVLFSGGELAYDFEIGETWRMRLYAQFLTDITIDDRQVFQGLGGFQIGFPLTAEKEEEEEEDDFDEEEFPEEESIQLVDLTEDIVRFETSSALLVPESKRRIVQLGRFLADNQDLWERIRVDGHTDRRFTLQYNMILSRNRARSVARALVQGGVPRNRIGTRGFGPTRPVDDRNTKDAWAKNRRVNLRFWGVADEDLLRNKLNDVRKKNFRIPNY